MNDFSKLEELLTVKLTSCFLLILFSHDAFADHDNDWEKDESKYFTPVNNKTLLQEF
jgi:hypothetical protein